MARNGQYLVLDQDDSDKFFIPESKNQTNGDGGSKLAIVKMGSRNDQGYNSVQIDLIKIKVSMILLQSIWT